MTERVTRKIVVGGKEYSSVDEMPPDVRQLYEKAMSMLADKDANGIPDILEGKSVGISAIATEVLKGLANGTAKVTISTNVKVSRIAGSAGGDAGQPAALHSVEAPAAGVNLNTWVVRLLLGAGVLLVLRLLGLIS